MDWLVRGINDVADLLKWQQHPFTPGVDLGPQPRDNGDNHTRVVAQEESGPPQRIARQLADAILRFDIFPPHVAHAVLARSPVQVGDTVGLRYHFVPWCLDLLFASRVVDRFEHEVRGQWRCGFTYRTLQGHPECGEETFVVEKDLATGKVAVALRSWSRPGTVLAKLTYPLMRRLQLRAGRSALDHLERIAAAEANAPPHASPHFGQRGVHSLTLPP
jgi:uncharacterized protein (UPF0548 family)